MDALHNGMNFHNQMHVFYPHFNPRTLNSGQWLKQYSSLFELLIEKKNKQNDFHQTVDLIFYI